MKEFTDSFKINIDQTTLVRAETISLKEVEDLRLADGSLLMKWQQVDSAIGKIERKLDYATAIMPGYKNMKNLSPAEAWGIFNYRNDGEAGQKLMAQHINPDSPTLLLPLQEARCPFNCRACPFAFDFGENKGKMTKNLGMAETFVLIRQSLDQAKKHDINISDIGISFVGSGDATPNPFLEELFKMIAKEFPNVKRVRFSTVAGTVPESRLTPMQTVAKILSNPEYKGQPLPSMQVSIHSTDENLRAEHVYEQKLNSEEVQSGKKKFTVED